MAAPQANAADITNVISSLASRQSNRPRAKPLSGPKRAAILMLALGEQYGGKIWQLLDDDEVRQLSLEMSTLGTVEVDTVEDMLLEFVSRMSASGALAQRGDHAGDVVGVGVLDGGGHFRSLLDSLGGVARYFAGSVSH